MSLDTVSLKQKILDAIAAHPKLAAFAIGAGITMAVGMAIGLLDQQHLAFAAKRPPLTSTSGSGP